MHFYADPKYTKIWVTVYEYCNVMCSNYVNITYFNNVFAF